MSAYSAFKSFGIEDCGLIEDQLRDAFPDARLKNKSFERVFNDDGTEGCDVTAVFEANGNTFSLMWSYSEDPGNDEDILMDVDIHDLIDLAIEKASRGVNSSTKARKHKIFAAEGDEDEESFADDEFLDEEDGFEDTLDEMADNIEDMQDTVDEITEDDVNIENDNNIDGHYIAECEKCHGIFISAVTESDQQITKISGTCPLCEKETDQYLKWVVKAVE